MSKKISNNIPLPMLALSKPLKEIYRILADNLPFGVYIVQEGKFQFINPEFQKYTGFTEEELLGLNPLTMVHPEDREHVRESALAMLRGNRLSPYEFRVIGKDGGIIWVMETVTSIYYRGRRAALGSSMDVTEHKRAEAALRKAHDELEMRVKERTSELRKVNEGLQNELAERKRVEEALRVANKELRETHEQLIRSEKLAAIGQLAGGVGHELRNPLGAIKNAIYYMKDKVTKSELAQREPRVMEFLEIMDEEINASNKIINDLLGFSLVGKPAVSLVRIEKVINDALSHIFIPRNIELVEKVDAKLPEVELDFNQIRQVLVNMITNAVQAMPEGGTLGVEAGGKANLLELKITDTGIGIPTETIPKIFDPLFTTRARGIGLGLAVCRAIIERHRGHIEVESERGKGTTFIIKLPLKREGFYLSSDIEVTDGKS